MPPSQSAQSRSPRQVGFTRQMSWTLVPILPSNDALLFRLLEQIGVQVEAPILFRLRDLDFHPVRFRVRIVADVGHLPGHLAPGLSAANLETILRDLRRDVQVRRRGAYRRQLIAK